MNEIKIKELEKGFVCDFCDEFSEGEPFDVFDENFNKQSGLKQCGECSTGIKEDIQI